MMVCSFALQRVHNHNFSICLWFDYQQHLLTFAEKLRSFKKTKTTNMHRQMMIDANDPALYIYIQIHLYIFILWFAAFTFCTLIPFCVYGIKRSIKNANRSQNENHRENEREKTSTTNSEKLNVSFFLSCLFFLTFDSRQNSLRSLYIWHVYICINLYVYCRWSLLDPQQQQDCHLDDEQFVRIWIVRGAS